MIYIGLDDTDNLTSRGTGRLAREIAATLPGKVLGVTRHQLLVDPRVPYTSHNSSAAIHLQEDGAVELFALADAVQAHMLADWQDGSDPGLCVARGVDHAMSEFGRQAKTVVVPQSAAHDVARRCGCILRGLGGTRDGVIGALAAVGLAGTGNDGRFLMIGAARDLQGIQTVSSVLESGIAEVRALDGQVLNDGMIDTGGKLRPAFRGGRPVLVVVRQAGEHDLWVPVKLD